MSVWTYFDPLVYPLFFFLDLRKSLKQEHGQRSHALVFLPRQESFGLLYALKPCTYLHVAPLRVNAVGVVLVAFQLPRKPTELRVVPGAIVASYERLVTVTWLPACEALAFQICVIVCP